jgi:hypothetical protein
VLRRYYGFEGEVIYRAPKKPNPESFVWDSAAQVFRKVE